MLGTRALQFEHGHEPLVGELEIAPGVGNKDLEFASSDRARVAHAPSSLRNSLLNSLQAYRPSDRPYTRRGEMQPKHWPGAPSLL